MFTLRRSTVTHWIALFAIWAAVLLPTASQLLGVGHGADRWTEICTQEGMRWVSADGQTVTTEDPGPGSQGSHGEHCPLCRLHADAPALPPPPAGLGVQSVQAQALPYLFLHAPRTLAVWRSAHPRGPPVLS